MVIWSTPKKRGKDTANIVRRVLKEAGVSVIENENKLEKKSLKDVRFSADLEIPDWGNWMSYWANNEGKIPENMEKPTDIKRRIQRVLTYLERIARQVNPKENKKLHFVCVTHEELFRDLLEEGFGYGTEKGTGPINGETLTIDINKSVNDGEAVFNMKFGDDESSLSFNSKSREFKKIK